VRHKTILLASAAAAALIIAEPAQAQGLYFSASGGANFMEDESAAFFLGKSTYGAQFDPDTGFLLETAVGLELDRWLHGLKVEMAMSYRRNKLGGEWTATTDEIIGPSSVQAAAIATGAITGHMSTFALMANAWYEFNVGSRFKPYLGGGVGWARSKTDGVFQEPDVLIDALAVDPFDGFSVTSSGFAYQLGAGVTSEVMPGVSLGLGYRYFDAPNTEIFFSGKSIGAVVSAVPSPSNSAKFDNISQSVALTLSIDIN
jgi:OmpA-OmpF porin, OOP family